MMDLDRPAKVRRIRDLIQRDKYLGPVELVGEERATAFVRAIETIRNAEHGPDWTAWDEASVLYDHFKDQLL